MSIPSLQLAPPPSALRTQRSGSGLVPNKAIQEAITPLSRKHLYVPAFYAGINIDIDFSFRTLEAAKKSLAEGNHQQFQTYQNSFQQYLTALKKKFSFAEENPDIISVPEATQKRFAELVQAIYELEASNPKALSGTTPLLNKQG